MKNTVELLGIYGDDTSHALSAWTSTNRELTEEKRNRIPKLLKTLVEGSHGNSHETPFEKSAIHFLVTTDIASHIHIIKHRIATSVNAESARYKELKEDKYYLPEDWKGIKTTHLPTPDDFGEYSIDFGSSNSDYTQWLGILDWYTRLGNSLYHGCVKDLEPSLGRKRAKESARFFKTYNSQISADVMFNFRSFIHFLKLRMPQSAQLEIRDIAKEMFKQVWETEKFRYSFEAFGFKIEE